MKILSIPSSIPRALFLMLVLLIVLSVSSSAQDTLEGHNSPSEVILGDLSDMRCLVSRDTLSRTFRKRSYEGLSFSVAFSSDGTKLASAGKSVHIWDVETGKSIHTLTGYTILVNSVVFSPDGTLLASGGWNKAIHLWDVATGKLIRTLTGHACIVNSVAFSPDGTKIAAGGWNKAILLWDVATGQFSTLKGHEDFVNTVSYSPDGTKLASGSCSKKGRFSCTEGDIRIWDVSGADPTAWSHIRTLTGHRSAVDSLSYSPDGKQLASGSADKTIRIWDVSGADPTAWSHIRTLTGHRFTVDSLSYSPDGTKLASGGKWDKTVLIWDVATGEHLYSLDSYSSVYEVSYSPDGIKIAVATGDKHHILEVPTKRPIYILKGHRSRISSVSYSPDGTKLASGSCGKMNESERCIAGEIRIWDIATGQSSVITGHSTWVYSLSFSPDSTRLVSGSCGDLDAVFNCTEGEIGVWDVATGKHLRTFKGHGGYVNSVSYSPDGRKIASGSCGETSPYKKWWCIEGEIRIWDVWGEEATTWSHIRTLAGHNVDVNTVSFSSDGTKVISSADYYDNRILIWDVATGKHLRTFRRHNAVLSYSPDGSTVASGLDSTLCLWDVATGKHLQTLVVQGVASLLYSPDGETLASVNGDDIIQLWDVSTGKHLQTLVGHNGGANSVSFSPDGNAVASGGEDNIIRIWDVKNKSETFYIKYKEMK